MSALERVIDGLYRLDVEALVAASARRAPPVDWGEAPWPELSRDAAKGDLDAALDERLGAIDAALEDLPEPPEAKSLAPPLDLPDFPGARAFRHVLSVEPGMYPAHRKDEALRTDVKTMWRAVVRFLEDVRESVAGFGEEIGAGAEKITVRGDLDGDLFVTVPADASVDPAQALRSSRALGEWRNTRLARIVAGLELFTAVVRILVLIVLSALTPAGWVRGLWATFRELYEFIRDQAAG